MDHATSLVALFHIVIAVLLTIIVLLQDSKGDGLGGSFGGGGGSQTLFGATGAATFLVKLTRGLAVIFAITSMSLVYMVTHKNSRSVIDTLPVSSAPKAAAPANPAAAPVLPAAPANPATPGK